jgi:hypothetical protein
MNTAIKTMMIGVAVCSFAAPAFAYTLTGTIPANKSYSAIQLQKPPPGSGILKLTLSGPPANAGWAMNFCVAPASAPASHPCASNEPLFVTPGQHAIVFEFPSIYPSTVVWVGKGTNVAEPYTLDVDYIP